MNKENVKSTVYFDRNVLVFGAAGISGQAISRLLIRLGTNVFLYDQSPKKYHPEIQFQIDKNLLVKNFTNDPETILQENEIDFIVIASGIPLTHDFLKTARQKGITIHGEMDLAYKIMQDYFKESMQPNPPIVAITGTDGKSTTTAMLSGMIEHATGWHSISTGNFGFPFSLCVLAIIGVSESRLEKSEIDIFKQINIAGHKIIPIVENSSYQLESTDTYRPDISVFLNLSEDHLDRYENLNHYFLAKMNITKNQNQDDLFIAPVQIHRFIKENKIKMNVRSTVLPDMDSLSKNKSIMFQRLDLLKNDEFKLPGKHNRQNLEAAIMCLEELNARFSVGINKQELADFIQDFKGLPHRLESICKKDNIEFINDSKATTVQAVESAISSFIDNKIYLLLGGRAKNLDFSPLATLIKKHAIECYIYGESKQNISEVLKIGRSYDDLQEAFYAAVSDAKKQNKEPKKNIVILLSPGCASFDAYADYNKRGEHFCDLAMSGI